MIQVFEDEDDQELDAYWDDAIEFIRLGAEAGGCLVSVVPVNI